MTTPVYYYILRTEINNNLFNVTDDTHWSLYFKHKYKFKPRFIFKPLPIDFYTRKNHEKKIEFNDVYHFWW